MAIRRKLANPLTGISPRTLARVLSETPTLKSRSAYAVIDNSDVHPACKRASSKNVGFSDTSGQRAAVDTWIVTQYLG